MNCHDDNSLLDIQYRLCQILFIQFSVKLDTKLRDLSAVEEDPQFVLMMVFHRFRLSGKVGAKRRLSLLSMF